jgi:hypothetical protein
VTMTDTRGLAGAELAGDAVAVEALVVDVDVIVLELEDAPNPGAPNQDGKRPRHLRVAPDSVRRRRHVRIAAAAAAVSISATLFAVVGFNVELAQHQIQLQRLEGRLVTEQNRYYDLRDEVAQRSAPSEVVRLAKKLGLVGPVPLTYVPAPIPLPPVDPAATANVLGTTKQQTGSSLVPPQ